MCRFGVPISQWDRAVVILISAVAAGFSCSQCRTHLVADPVMSERFYGAIQGRIIGINRSLSEKPRLTLDQLALYPFLQHVTPNRLLVALYGRAQDHVPQISDIEQLAAHLLPTPGHAEPNGYDFQRQARFG